MALDVHVDVEVLELLHVHHGVVRVAVLVRHVTQDLLGVLEVRDLGRLGGRLDLVLEGLHEVEHLEVELLDRDVKVGLEPERGVRVVLLIAREVGEQLQHAAALHVLDRKVHAARDARKGAVAVEVHEGREVELVVVVVVGGDGPRAARGDLAARLGRLHHPSDKKGRRGEGGAQVGLKLCARPQNVFGPLGEPIPQVAKHTARAPSHLLCDLDGGACAGTMTFRAPKTNLIHSWRHCCVGGDLCPLLVV